jgi:hypothetical protein
VSVLRSAVLITGGFGIGYSLVPVLVYAITGETQTAELLRGGTFFIISYVLTIVYMHKSEAEYREELRGCAGIIDQLFDQLCQRVRSLELEKLERKGGGKGDS